MCTTIKLVICKEMGRPFKTSNLNLEYFELWFINPEGRNLEFWVEKLKLAHTQDIGVLDPNFIGGKNEFFITIHVWNLKNSKWLKYWRFLSLITRLILFRYHRSTQIILMVQRRRSIAENTDLDLMISLFSYLWCDFTIYPKIMQWKSSQRIPKALQASPA